MSAALHACLIDQWDHLVANLDGLDDYAVRRPMTRTGTNLLGLVKHVASVNAEYFGVVFDRPFPVPLPWTDAEADADLWVPAEESRTQILDLHAAAVEHANATIAALPMDAVGFVPWWSEARRRPTLHDVLVHAVAETARHAGHADILREQLDGHAGYGRTISMVTRRSDDEWHGHVARIEHAAKVAGGVAGSQGTGGFE